MPINVILVDDEDLFRRGLGDWLASLPDVTVIGEACSADEALALLENTVPDIALVDIRLPGISGISLTQKMSDLFPSVKALVLSGSSTPDLVLNAFESGAWGFLPKEISSEELSLAIRKVHAGLWYLSPHVTEDVIRSSMLLRGKAEEVAAGNGHCLSLSNRERELLKLIAEGHTFTEIAKHLSINARSVERLKAKLELKLNADNLVDLIREAIKLGLVEA